MTLRQGARLLAPWLFTLALSAQAGAPLSTHRHLYPIGGAYETALEGYAREVMRHAQGPAIDIVMLPAAFADDPVLPEDPIILAEDVQSLQTACEAVLARSSAKARFPAGCKVSSAPLYLASDAHHSAILAALSDASLDGVFFTGGQQDYAMRILAGTPAEAILSNLADRGLVIGGTSAGAAIESLAMNAGYTDWGDSTTALQKGAIDMWMAQAGDKRGLSFGSTRLVIDEHVYSRGRLGRMLNAAAQTADAFGQGGLLGLGLDYDTGVPVREDRWLGDVAQSLRNAGAVMFDQAMACAVGDHYDAAPGGDTQDDAIAAFRVGSTVLKPGLGVVHGAAFEPRLQTERRWGRLYGLGAQRKAWPAYGVSESTAISLTNGRATVVGTNPVVVLDTRRALFAKGDNGALAAINVLLDVYEPGEVLGW